MKTFKSGRDRRPPEPFVVEYEVEVKEKVQVPAIPGSLDLIGGIEERATGLYETHSRQFHARYSAIPAGIMLAAGESGPAQAAAIRKVLECAVVERDDLIALLSDPEAVIAMDTFIEIFEWLSELAAGRPTTKPSS
ncbi:hypothetical protein [Glutamicibacter sp. V16R2B1]|uniref:hypothetical protein n=1 Tax=Glutamicibacter sp. V16R2B1 TaxID=2036207 RepID=UPI0010FDD71B|nr:hypothetical protein [Glutamicibacter sp. V16R2B1]MCK9901289.1 hypothetical protein [Frankia sp. Cpl3]TLK48138.1 hypothetical protein FDN03_15400 [Glutamicibacter sp. V16R2B1]